MKVFIASDITADDRSHTRHFYEELVKLPGVFFGDASPADADWTINNWHPASGSSIRLYRPDPHAFTADCDIRDLLDPEQAKLLTGPETPSGWLEMMIERLTARRAGRSVIPELDCYDLLALSSMDPLEPMFTGKTTGRILHLQMTVPSWAFHSDGTEDRPIDTMFLGCRSYYYPLRRMMLRTLPKATDVGFYDMPRMKWKAPDYSIDKFDAHQCDYGVALRATKIAPFCGSIFNYPVQKYLESMACGALVCAPIPRDAELLGFVDGETMVAVTAENYMDKIREYLANDAERKRITANARDLVVRNYTCEVSARRFMENLEAIKGGADPTTLRGIK